MSKTDFQNGFALGMASGGVVEVIVTPQLTAETITAFTMKTKAYEEVEKNAQ